MLYNTGAQPSVLCQPRGVEWGEGWEGDSVGRGHMYTYGWFTWLYSRNQHNIVKQLPSNLNYKKGKSMTKRSVGFWKSMLRTDCKDVWRILYDGNVLYLECYDWGKWVYTFVKSHRVVHLKWVLCKLYLIKSIILKITDIYL